MCTLEYVSIRYINFMFVQFSHFCKPFLCLSLCFQRAFFRKFNFCVLTIIICIFLDQTRLNIYNQVYLDEKEELFTVIDTNLWD